MRSRLPSHLRQVRRRWWVISAVVLVALIAGGWTWMGRDDGSDTQRITATVARGTYKTIVSATGTITPKREADLTFSSSGTVTRVAVSAGDRVQEGDVLATIDTTALQAQLDAAEAQVTAARAQLAEDGDAATTQQAADQASLASAESGLSEAQDALDAATIRAPFAGTVSTVGFEVGDQVGSSSGNSPNAGSSASSDNGSTTPAITLISPKALQVDANVSASDVSKLKKGMQVVITPTGGGDVDYGTVSEIGVIATASDSGAAQFPVTIDVTGQPTGLYAGSTASVAITIKQASDVLAVATRALHTSGDQTFVYLLHGSKRTEQVVKVGETYGIQTAILSGLKAGDVVEIASFARPGASGTGRNNYGAGVRQGGASYGGFGGGGSYGGFGGGGSYGQGLVSEQGGGSRQ